MGDTPRMDQEVQHGGGSDSAKVQKSKCADKDIVQIDRLIGDFGTYQFLIYMFKILIGVSSAFNNLGVTFFAPNKFVGHECAYLGTNGNSTFISQTNLTMSMTNLSTKSPDIYVVDLFSEFLSSEVRDYKHGLNSSYDTPKKVKKECTYQTPHDSQSHPCTSYKYDTGIWISTIIDEWDLVCDRFWLVSMTQALYMSGFILSYLVFGYTSDRYGRWKSLLVGASFEVLAGFGCALSTSVTMFMFFRFWLGFGNAGRSSSSYLIMIEWVGPEWRMFISTMGSLGWVIGYCAMPWITMYFLHFRHVQLFICLYEFTMVVCLLGLPESPRWLLTHKRFEEAHMVLLRAAKINGLIIKGDEKRVHLNPPLPEANPKIEPALHMKLSKVSCERSQPLQACTRDEFDIKFKNLINGIKAKEFTKNENRLTILDLFKWKNLRRYAFILFFIWATDSFIYYGIVLNVGDFGGNNLFVSFTIAGLTELPSLAFTIVCMKLLPRRTTNIFLFSMVAILCLLNMPLKHYELRSLQQATMMMAKLFNSCAFTVILYQTMEIFPTSIRQTAYSSCSLAGRVGSILAPFIKPLTNVTSDGVAPVLFVILSLVSCILVTGLPETKGSDLTDTLLEAEKLGDDEKCSKKPR